MRKIFLIFILLCFCGNLGAEPLQTDLFVFMKPSPVMGKLPTNAKYTVVDSSDAWAKKLYDSIANDPETLKVLQRYQKVQMDSMKKYREKLVSEGKSTAEIDALLAKKANPIYFVLKNGKGTPMMTSGSAFIETYKDGKLSTDYQYVCPKVSIPNGWEGFPKDLSEPFSDATLKEFRNLINHETSHAIMKEMYGYIPKGINPLAALGHWEGKVTTQQLAFTEGYAEFMGAWYGKDRDYENPEWTKDQLSGLPKTEKENKKTEGVNACIFWDIAGPDGGIANGMEKIHAVLAASKPWTISSFAEAFKKAYPEDVAAINQIMRQNLIPEKDSLFSSWFNIKSTKKQLDVLEKEYDRLGWFSSPWKKIKTWWNISKKKSLLKKLMTRYQSMYGYTSEQLTSPDAPKTRKPVAPPVVQPNVDSVKEVKTTGAQSPFQE